MSEPIQHGLRTLMPRLRRHYPTIDNLTFTDVLEEARQRLAEHEATRGLTPGSYRLVLRRRGESWRFYPLHVE